MLTNPATSDWPERLGPYIGQTHTVAVCPGFMPALGHMERHQHPRGTPFLWYHGTQIATTYGAAGRVMGGYNPWTPSASAWYRLASFQKPAQTGLVADGLRWHLDRGQKHLAYIHPMPARQWQSVQTFGMGTNDSEFLVDGVHVSMSPGTGGQANAAFLDGHAEALENRVYTNDEIKQFIGQMDNP